MASQGFPLRCLRWILKGSGCIQQPHERSRRMALNHEREQDGKSEPYREFASHAPLEYDLGEHESRDEDQGSQTVAEVHAASEFTLLEGEAQVASLAGSMSLEKVAMCGSHAAAWAAQAQATPERLQTVR